VTARLVLLALAIAACGTRDATTTGASAPTVATSTSVDTATATSTAATSSPLANEATAAPSTEPARDQSLPRGGILVELSDEGITITTPSGHVGTGCKGNSGVTIPRAHGAPVDFAALTRCARTLKSDPKLATLEEVAIAASRSTPFKDVVGIIDATRSDSQGDLFPNAQFTTPPSSKPTSPSAPAPPRSPPPAPSSPTTHTGASPMSDPVKDPPVILISKTGIEIEDEHTSTTLVDLRGVTDLATFGLPASVKRAGRDDTFIVPLADDLARRRAMVRSVGKEEALRAMIACDRETPYGVFFEVVSTLTASGFGRYDLMVAQKH